MPAQFTFDGDVVFNPQQLKRALQQATPGGLNIPITFKDNASLPLGKVVGNIKDFDRSLDAATDRVVAFGAAAGVFTLVSKAVNELVSSTVEVENALIRIGTNFNRSEQEIAQFGKTLFDIARQTGNTFADAAKGAEELARQGLSIAETQKRLKDALVLSRISGTDVNDTIQNLTATLLTFNEAGLDSTKIINKIVSVDVSAAVSAKDLQEAFARVGSSAKDAGVSFDQLLSLITSVKERTGRDGAVIGNSLKTIFTRLERPKVLETLQQLGVAVKDTAGEALPAVQILTELAKTYETLSDAQKSLVTEQVAGGYQINIIKALLGDLSKETSRYNEVLKISANAQDAAAQKNEKFNESLKSTLNATAQSITQIFSAIGGEGGGIFTKLLQSFNEFVSKGLSGDKGEGAGKTFAEGLISGISNVLTGPALVTAGALLVKVLGTISTRVAQELQGYIGIGNELKAQIALQQTIDGLLSKATASEQAMFAAAVNVTKQKEIILAISERILATDISIQARNSALRGQFDLKRPNFAGGSISDAVFRENSAIKAGVGGASLAAKPVVLPNFNGLGPVVANTDEYLVPNKASGGSSIYNKDMVSKYGLPSNAVNLGSKGYIPNYAGAFSALRGQNGKFVYTGELNNAFSQLENSRSLDASLVFGAKIQRLLKDLKLSKQDEQLVYNKLGEAINVKSLLEKSPSNLPEYISPKRKAKELEAIYNATKQSEPRRPKISLNDAEIGMQEYRASQEAARRSTALQNTPIIRSGSTPASIQDFLTRRQSEAGFGADYNPVAYGGNASVQDSAIRQITSFNQARARLAGGEQFGNLSKEQRANFIRATRQSVSQELYGKKFTPDTLAANPEAASAIREEVSRRIKSLTPSVPPNLEKILENNPLGRSNSNPFGLSERFGLANPQKRFESLVAEGKLKDTPELRRQAQYLSQQRSSKLANIGLGAAFVAPFAAGFLPEGQGGTTSGAALGGLKGAAQGAGIGGIFGPAGLAIGAAFGLIAGIVSKASKSLEEFQQEIDKSTAITKNNFEQTQSALQTLGQYKEAISQGKSQEASKLLSQYGGQIGGVSNVALRKALESANIENITKALGEEAQNSGRSLSGKNAVQSVRAGAFEGDIRKALVGNISNALDPQKINSEIFKKIRNFQSFDLNIDSTGKSGGQITEQLNNLYGQFDKVKNTLSELNPEFKDLELNSGNYKDVLIAFGEALGQSLTSQNKFTEAVKNQVALLGGVQQSKINETVGGLFETRRAGLFQKLDIFAQARSQINSLTNGPEGATTATANDEKAINDIKLRKEADDLLRERANAEIESKQKNEGKVTEEDRKKIETQYQNSLAQLTEKYKTLNDVIDYRATVEKKLADFVRRQTVGAGGNYSGSNESRQGGALSNYNNKGFYTRLGDAGKQQLNEGYLAALAKLDALGAKPEEGSAANRRRALKFKVQEGGIYGEATSFLEGLNPNRLYRDQFGSINKTAVQQSLDFFSRPSNGFVGQESRDIAARYRSAVGEASSNVLNPLEKPTDLSSVKTALETFNKEQDDVVKRVQKLFDQVKSTDIKILTNLEGTINIVAQSLSPEALAALSASIKAQILPIINDRIQQEKNASKSGIPNPPSAKNTAVPVPGFTATVNQN